MSLLTILEQISDSRAFELGQSIAATTQKLMLAKQKKASADAAVLNAVAQQEAAASDLTAIQAEMQALRESLAAELSPQ